MAQTRNSYILVDSEPEVIDVFAPRAYGLGEDFYVSVFREIETGSTLAGVTFFLAYHVPDSLPRYGPDVVLVVLADEAYQHRAYFSDLGCVLRCLGVRPTYLDGAPLSGLRAAALAHYIYKSARHLLSVANASRIARSWSLAKVERRTLHIPLGLYATFDPVPMPMRERPIDYAFLGSLGFDERFRKFIHRLISPPKILARRAMLRAIEALPPTLNGRLRATGDFWESVQTPQAYVEAMSGAKIALVPRGTSYETYRFFEACKAGCVIVCEPLPDAWFYRGHPGVVVRDWSQAPAVVMALLDDPERLAAISARTLNYWADVACEGAIADKIARFVEDQRVRRKWRKATSGAATRGSAGSEHSAAMPRPAEKIFYDV